ncbi:gliding motility-associated C-terminal domain-containing protein [Chitinophaga rupis]|uniref:Gliding motility-associated C-terminal domain-containing protein n=1 Tax=Chitinophaga rupis TaxID=573321 RepID=A0A1H8A2M1_9BACT|nr:PKD domain-containing protein [Chitinophaga rupis]SEM64029.1 gliding motility-associated C-terminal domain-containing protein [Chitinophaga rupis]
MKTIFIIVLTLAVCPGMGKLYAQTYTPVAITGFNNDVVADTGTSAVAVTTTPLDLSFNVLYSAAFGVKNVFPGGLPNTGTIVSGVRTYQLAPYDTSNGLFLSLNGAVANSAAAGTLTLVTPASFSKISLLLFSTEGSSTLRVTLNFTDGTTAVAGTATVLDWFGGGNAVYSGFGRTTRIAAPPYVADGIATNDPRFYKYDVSLACANQAKQLQSITINFLGGGTTFPSRAVILALSGMSITPLSITPTITPAICGSSNGGIELAVTGGAQPLSYSWNTVPVQSQPSITNQPGGPYTCTILDANGCTTLFQDTIPQQSASTLSVTASADTVCNGTAVTLNASASGGTVSNYQWQPNNAAGQSITVTPAATTVYVVTAQDAFGCSLKDSVEVAIKPMPVAGFTVTPATVCLGASQTIQFTGTAAATATYNWNNFSGATIQSGSGAGPYTITFNTAANYTLQLQVTDNGCASATVTQPVTVTAAPVVSFDVSDLTPCAGDAATITFTGNAGAGAVPVWGWGGGTVQSGSGFGPYKVQYSNSGSISLAVTNGACTVNATPRQVTVIPVPVAAFSQDVITGCPDLPVTFTDQSQNADTWLWRFGDGSVSSTGSPVHNFTTPGTYTVTLIAGAQQQCFDTLVQTALINVVPSPVAKFTTLPGVNVPLEFSEALFSFTNQSTDATSYAWDFGDGTTAATATASHQYALPGEYRVALLVSNSIGCTDSTSQAWLKVIPDAVLRIPNAFSPNRDGVNDFWEIPGLAGIPGCHVEIFNRWGQRIFESTGYRQPWDGTWHGQQMPVATYYYVIKAKPKDKPYAGWVALLR